jgi:hypothetical protein
MAEKDKILEAIKKQRLIRDAAKRVSSEISSEREQKSSPEKSQESARH